MQSNDRIMKNNNLKTKQDTYTINIPFYSLHTKDNAA